MYLILSKDDVVFDSPKISLNVEESARFFLKVGNLDPKNLTQKHKHNVFAK